MNSIRRSSRAICFVLLVFGVINTAPAADVTISTAPTYCATYTTTVCGSPDSLLAAQVAYLNSVSPGSSGGYNYSAVGCTVNSSGYATCTYKYTAVVNAAPASGGFGLALQCPPGYTLSGLICVMNSPVLTKNAGCSSACTQQGVGQ